MNLVATIKGPVLDEIQMFEKAFVSALESKNPLLSSVNEYVLQGSGKQLRPILVLLCAKLCGEVSETTIESAVALELLHTASLIHDDVVDDTNERRGNKSINAQWNNKIAILSGDYMLSNALYHATKTKNLGVLHLISNIGMQLSDGELLQLASMDQVKINEKEYYNIIRKKTALLFSTCTEIGALSANATTEQLTALRNFGEYLGVCFQLKDDIFDYYENADIGKPTGNDVRDGKVTLPLIYALQNAALNERDEVIGWINKKDFSAENIRRIMNFTHKNGGIAYAEAQMEVYKNKAIEELNSFTDNDVKKSLVTCAEFVVDRNK